MNFSSLGNRSNGPPSRERETWMEVSFVRRCLKAVRRGGEASGGEGGEDVVEGAIEVEAIDF